MEILLDEMYTGLKEYFEILGWDVTTVEEAELRGADDKEIVRYAKENNLLLVTQDRKPAELSDLEGAKFVLISKKSIARLIDSEIRKKYREK